MVSDCNHDFPSLEIKQQMHILTFTQKFAGSQTKNNSLDMYVLQLYFIFSFQILRLTTVIYRQDDYGCLLHSTARHPATFERVRDSSILGTQSMIFTLFFIIHPELWAHFLLPIYVMFKLSVWLLILECKIIFPMAK